MKLQLIADSCCDTTPAMRKTLGVQLVPLTISVEGQEFVDTPALDTKKLLAAMKQSPKPVSTAAPSPGAYAEVMERADKSVVVTLSSQLSGSYNAAVAGRALVLEKHPDKQIEVFDSKSAAAGELRILLRIFELAGKGDTFEQLCEKMRGFIDNMRTLFVLDDLSNLIKNGRIPRMAGMLGTVLQLRPIMGENGEGEIIPLEKVRGMQKALARLVELVAEKTAGLAAQSLLLTLSYCNCPERAAELKKNLLAHCPAVGDVMVVPTGGISTVYANNGGIVIAYG